LTGICGIFTQKPDPSRLLMLISGSINRIKFDVVHCMKIPPFLVPGAKVRIVSPAGKCSEEQIISALNFLKENGYNVVTGNHVLGHYFQFSGTESERLADFQEALDDPEAKVIICSRGGYGTIRLVDQLDFTRFRKHPKWIVGYSDITVLHNRLHLSGYQSVHGIMCRNFLQENVQHSESMQSLIRLLTAEKPIYNIPVFPINRFGTATALLVGGNLSILYSLIGTPYDLDTAGKILIIEDTGEYLYHIERMMISLRLSGKLKFLSGLIVGQFTDVKDNEEPFGKTVEEIISDSVKDYDYPVCFGFPAGHAQPNLALRLGARYNLKITKKECSLKIL
jgi:muramoyltetrapeptide carboxypeptidase